MFKSILRLSLLLAGPVALIGCGASDTAPPPAVDANYALASRVSNVDSDSTYISLITSLDSVNVDLKNALEIPGAASVAAYGGWLFVGGGESPTITRYSITADGGFVPETTLSFANQDLGDFGVYIDDWGNTFINAHKAYLSNSSSSTIVWDPTEMVITGTIEQPELVRDAPLSFDGSPGVVSGNRLYRTFFWKDWDEYQTYPEQYLAVFDVEHDKLLEIVPEQRCPGMNNNLSSDEDGNIYFSNWVYNVTETLGRGAPKSCALRLDVAKERFDDDFQLTFSNLADGREGAALTYLKKDKAVFAAFYDENVTIDAKTDLNELALSANWRLWETDLKTKTAAPLPGVDWLAGGYAVVHVDGRTFLMVPGVDYAQTTVHELDAEGGASKAFEIPGDSYQILKLR
ncbi:MAG: hypothetical protein ABW061_26980 [Polyangiaceae bacterium]